MCIQNVCFFVHNLWSKRAQRLLKGISVKRCPFARIHYSVVTTETENNLVRHILQDAVNETRGRMFSLPSFFRINIFVEILLEQTL